ncbi:hypothetical protein [Chlorobium sp. N1]|uniref:hypothetical protein n=1 Tax=Chlorobium sp. N1 TaxID=2491138 RepID=UPI0010389D52|nr:hypothetical protein [Chlorobium sp. N1]TCD46845.1 hypothetical protein E0L29_11185 [Chlorobium sp. N1]
MQLITKELVSAATAPSPWDLGNEVLYALCREHPFHDHKDAIIAKVWLIGRAYAAAIERRIDAREPSDDFYQYKLAPAVAESQLDEWLRSLPHSLDEPWRQLGEVVAVHKALVDLFAGITGMNKRSLASKYLHFHRPDLFFLYDSRAKAGLAALSSSLGKPPRITIAKQSQMDPEYHKHVRRCQWVSDQIAERFDQRLTPRQLDSLLLSVSV